MEKLIAGRGMAPMGLKVEKLETYDNAKHHDVDTWLFQVAEHMLLTKIPADSQVAYAASLLRKNTAMWWRELRESRNRLDAWDAVKTNSQRQIYMRIWIFIEFSLVVRRNSEKPQRFLDCSPDFIAHDYD